MSTAASSSTRATRLHCVRLPCVPALLSGMPPTVDLVVNVIGWKPSERDPPSLAPQFINPVAVRVYTLDGVRSTTALLRVEDARVIAAIDLSLPQDPDRPDCENVAGIALRCFCCTVREYEPRSHIERRRITSIDLCVVETRR